MFTGIVESMTQVLAIEQEGSNVHLTLQSPFEEALKIDQSIAHNGVCLTVVALEGTSYTVTAIEETLKKTNIGELKVGDWVNLERCMKLGDRLDGHIVQGHVDTTARCIKKQYRNGSWEFRFQHEVNDPSQITVSKGSVCINGISLTVVDSTKSEFSVAIIPYTYEHTNLQFIKEGEQVNIEFDILGKYLAKMQGFAS